MKKRNNPRKEYSIILLALLIIATSFISTTLNIQKTGQEYSLITSNINNFLSDIKEFPAITGLTVEEVYDFVIQPIDSPFGIPIQPEIINETNQTTIEPLPEQEPTQEQVQENQEIQQELQANLQELQFGIQAKTITIADVSQEGTRTNITNETLFSHLTINDSNLYFYMPFDANVSNTNTYDYSPNNNDGTFTNNAHITTGGIHGNTLTLDGVDDNINIANLNISQDVGRNGTIALWARIDYSLNAITADNKVISGEIVSANGIFLVFLKEQNRTQFQIDTTTANDCNLLETESATTLNLKWDHYVMTWNDTRCTIYRNGAEFESDAMSGNSMIANSNTRIGTQANNLVGDFGGLVDEVRIYNRSLSASEASALFQNQSNSFLSRGEHIFVNKNVSNLGYENRINISINSTLPFSSIINVSVGNQSGNDYTYGTEANFSNDQTFNLSLNTPNNISLKFIFYAGNTSINQFRL